MFYFLVKRFSIVEYYSSKQMFHNMLKQLTASERFSGSMIETLEHDPKVFKFDKK